MAHLNLHHLRLFRAVAHEGTLTGAARRLNLSQSALSAQVKALEASLGHALFERRGRGLVLTEAGQIALDHADEIFRAAEDLSATLSETGRARRALRVGGLSTLSRNFQISLLRPMLGRADVEVVLRSGSQAELLRGLEALALDVVLTNLAPARDAASRYIVRRLAEQPVSLIGTPARLQRNPTGAKRGSQKLRDRSESWIGRPDSIRSNAATGAPAPLADLLAREPLILPTAETSLRAGFDALTGSLGLSPRIAAEVDDMAMMRLLAREDAGLAVLPPIVVKDELASGTLMEAHQLPGITESFLAVTLDRRFPNPLVGELLAVAAFPVWTGMKS